jgi:hypothetical protein
MWHAHMALALVQSTNAACHSWFQAREMVVFLWCPICNIRIRMLNIKLTKLFTGLDEKNTIQHIVSIGTLL